MRVDNDNRIVTFAKVVDEDSSGKPGVSADDDAEPEEEAIETEAEAIDAEADTTDAE